MILRHEYQIPPKKGTKQLSHDILILIFQTFFAKLVLCEPTHKFFSFFKNVFLQRFFLQYKKLLQKTILKEKKKIEEVVRTAPKRLKMKLLVNRGLNAGYLSPRTPSNNC